MLIQYAIKGYALIPGELYGSEFIPSSIEVTPNEIVKPYNPFTAEKVYDSLTEAEYVYRGQIKAVADDLLSIARLNRSMMPETSTVTRYYIRRKLEIIPVIRINNFDFYYIVQQADSFTVKKTSEKPSNVYMTLQAALDNLLNLLNRQ